MIDVDALVNVMLNTQSGQTQSLPIGIIVTSSGQIPGLMAGNVMAGLRVTYK